nr:hypothetical protein [Morchella crassipes]
MLLHNFVNGTKTELPTPYCRLPINYSIAALLHIGPPPPSSVYLPASQQRPPTVGGVDASNGPLALQGGDAFAARRPPPPAFGFASSLRAATEKKNPEVSLHPIYWNILDEWNLLCRQKGGSSFCCAAASPLALLAHPSPFLYKIKNRGGSAVLLNIGGASLYQCMS